MNNLKREIFDKYEKNVRERLETATDALEEIQQIGAYSTEKEIKISFIALNALTKIYTLLYKNTQD